MACPCPSQLLDGGISKGCENNSGGITNLYLTEKCNVTSVELDVDGVIDTINMLSGASFYEFSFNKNTSTFTEVWTQSLENSSLLNTQTVTLKLARREKTKRDTLALLMYFKDLVAIVKDSNGIYWYLGEENGLNVTENNSESGTAKADFNGYTITLVGEETTLANEVLAAAVTAVI